MTQEQDIKPIPKYMLQLIKRKDNLAYEKYSGTRFYSYFTKHKKRLLKITVAVRNKG